MKLPSLTGVVIFGAIGALGYGSYNLYTRVAVEGRKAMNDATEYLEDYDPNIKEINRRNDSFIDGGKAEAKAKREAEKSRKLFERKLSDSRVRKQEKK